MLVLQAMASILSATTASRLVEIVNESLEV